jgi:hypothetical protein
MGSRKLRAMANLISEIEWLVGQAQCNGCSPGGPCEICRMTQMIAEYRTEFGPGSPAEGPVSRPGEPEQSQSPISTQG